MEGLGSTHSQNYDLRPRRGESLKDWFAKVLYRLEYCDMQFQDVDGVMHRKPDLSLNFGCNHTLVDHSSNCGYNHAWL